MTVSTKTINVIVSKNSSTGVITTQPPVTLKNIPTISSGIDTVDELVDVNISQRTGGATLVYNDLSNLYEVKSLEFVDIVGDLDGGSF